MIKAPEVPVEWVSLYGNITFNQVGRDFPASGMNVKDLVVEQTTLWNTIYPDRDKRKAMKELQLIQYLLDVCSTTREAVDLMSKVCISQEMAKLQYILVDCDGDISLVEFILGEMKMYSNKDFAYQVITNDMIGTSLDYLNTHSGFGGSKPVQYSKYSLDRYVVAVDAIQKRIRPGATLNGFEILDLSKCNDTQWQIMYNLKARRIEWRTASNAIVKELCLYDFENKSECFTIEIDTKEQKPYAKSRNRELANCFFKESLFFKGIKIKEMDIEILVSHPEENMVVQQVPRS